MSDIVERLLWWGAKNKPPRGMDTLPADCREAASRISQQDAELERLRRHIELLQEKDASQCACSIDTPDDVCLFHVRMKAEARKAAFIEAAEIAEQTIVPNSSGAALGANLRAERIAGALRAKAEETGR